MKTVLIAITICAGFLGLGMADEAQESVISSGNIYHWVAQDEKEKEVNADELSEAIKPPLTVEIVKPRPIPKQRVEALSADNIYVPPPRKKYKKTKQNNVVGVKPNHWLHAELKRSVSSEDDTRIEFYLVDHHEAQYQVIPAGTLLIGRHGFNARSERLDVVIEKMLFANGDEVLLKGTVFDAFQNIGLPGVVSLPEEESSMDGLVKGAKGVINGSMELLPAGVSDAAQGVTDKAFERVFDEPIDDEWSQWGGLDTLDDIEAEEETVITVPPQWVLIRIDEAA